VRRYGPFVEQAEHQAPSDVEHVEGGAPGRTALLKRLMSTAGADLYDVRGRRLGKFIEVVGDGREVAIRHDGAFVWRRRTLPASRIATVVPEHGECGAVILNVDREGLNDAIKTRAAAEGGRSGDGERQSEEELGARLARYVTPRNGDENAASARSTGESDDATVRHLLFVATPQGYRLVEQDGPAPAALDHLSLPGYDNLFRVMKLAVSPLPNDRRRCAYLEET
jgi:hypothetical protein